MEKYFLHESNLLSKDLVALLERAYFIIPNWKWMILVIAVVFGLIGRPILQFILKEIKKHAPFIKKFPNSFSVHFMEFQIEKPVAWLAVYVFWLSVGDAIDLSGKFETYYDRVIHALMAISIIRLVYHAVDAFGQVLVGYAKRSDSSLNDQLTPFATKTLKVIVVLLGFLIVLQNFGLNVMSLLAGLGLGGLALALAAQDTAANLFGSVTILMDTPFAIGDWVKVKDMEGTVEEIGFRSTRIRTFYNSVITIPNAMMAKETIDNMGVRPVRRIRQNLGLTYETGPDKIQEFCDRVRYLLIQHKEVQKDTISVFFNNYGDFALGVLLNFHIQVNSGPEELQLQQAIFIEILKLAQELKVDFAYPTHTVYSKDLPALM
jgi:MscS family membrane protein